MCGRYTLTDIKKLAGRFQVILHTPTLRPSYNIAPGQVMPVIVADGPRNAVKMMKWGLVPSWVKEPNVGYKMINARSEGIENKPSFRHAFKQQRCLVPASGFYEWRQNNDKTKTPEYIRLRDHDLFAFAGLWESWRQPDGTPLETYTVITTQANQLIAPVHDRMPVILQEQFEDAWLDPTNQDTEFLRTMLKPFDAAQMQMNTVSSAVNTVTNNQSALIKPINSK